MTRFKCSACGVRYAISPTLQLCEVCAYAAETSHEAAERQRLAAEAERERTKRAKAKAKAKP